MESHQIYIVDDEEFGLEILEYDLNRLDIPLTVTAFSDPTQALKAIQESPPDVLMLDVEMPVLNGFQLLDQLGQFDFGLIFITAYDHYAIRAFRYFAVDYILKPVDLDLLRTALERALYQQKQNSSMRYEALLDQLKSQRDKPITKIAIASGETYEFVNIADIIRCKADNNYSRVYLVGGREILVSKGLSQLQKILQHHNFFRTHKSHLISMDHIKRYVKSQGGYIEMADQSIVSLSRSRREDFLEVLRTMQLK